MFPLKRQSQRVPTSGLDTRSTAPPAANPSDAPGEESPALRAALRSPRIEAYPNSFLEQIEKEPRYTFVSAFGDALIMLVRADLDSTVHQGLQDFATDFDPELPSNPLSMPFSTMTRKIGTKERDTERKELDAASVRLLLVHSVHYMVPIRKRRSAARPATHRISLGRARNSDLVMRDPSVSKFHAWFECDERGKLFIADARSKNGTLLNGNELDARKLTLLNAGDIIKFGDVRVTIVSADQLWDAFHVR